MPIVTLPPFNPPAPSSFAGYTGGNDGANTILTLSGIGLQNANNLVRLDDTHAVLGFEDINNSSFYTAVVLTVGATTVTEGSLFVLHSISSNPTVSMEAVSPTVFTTVHKNVAGIGSGGIFASTWSVSGTTISAADISNALSTVTGPQFDVTARRFGSGAWVGISGDGLTNERVGSEAYSISGTTVATAQGTFLGPGLGGSGGLSGPPSSWGGINGQSAEGRGLGGGGSLPGNRVAFQYDAPSISDTIRFMTNSGGSTSAGAAYNPQTALPGGGNDNWQFAELRDDADNVFVVYDQSGTGDLSGATLTMSGNAVSATNTENVLNANTWQYDKSIIKTDTDEALIFGIDDNLDTGTILVTATDDNSMSAGSKVVYENGASRNSAMMVRMNNDQFLAVWADGFIVKARVVNRG